VDAIRWAVDKLTSRRVHPFFIAYLQIRATGVETGNMSQIRPQWARLGKYLEVPGGPPGKPYYRPFLDRVHDPTRYWMNQNLAGSWAPSSLREGQPPLEVVDRVGQGYSLKDNHARLAWHHLLFDDTLSVMALGVYLYRNHGFHAEGRESKPLDVIAAFASEFGFPEWRIDSTGTVPDHRRIDPVTGRVRGRTSNADFFTLFDLTIPERSNGWFEEFSIRFES
jgi:hypothetical protein